ncbi:hypothetical protein KP509_10G034000 [Ceratopteris richardii]|uniref:Uncharacterized protein n=1 Tax=Ceratopteris richardii TaxID=49495 RepID=A0A8T2TU76_CERRI|nr:hypothetical protein KP509_10G034000 [Ceratopteris richardii]
MPQDDDDDSCITADSVAPATDIESSPSSCSVTSQPSSSSTLITVKVAHRLRMHEVTLSADSTFGDLKTNLAPLTGLCPNEQRLLFKGKPNEDGDVLRASGVQNHSKLLLIDNPASKEKRSLEARQNERIAKACQAVAVVRVEVDKLSVRVKSLETSIGNGNKIAENTFAMLSELLMQQLLKLDSIDAEGEARAQRKTEVHFIRFY